MESFASDDEQLGPRLRSARVSSGMTQAELGRKVGVSPQQIGKYERGEDSLSVRRLQSLQYVLGAELVQFRPAQPVVSDEAASYDVPETEHMLTRRLLKAFRDLPREEQEDLLAELETRNGPAGRNDI